MLDQELRGKKNQGAFRDGEGPPLGLHCPRGGAQTRSAATLDELNAPPDNRLEALRGDRAGQHSIRINDRWRVCFLWESDGVYDVEIADYH